MQGTTDREADGYSCRSDIASVQMPCRDKHYRQLHVLIGLRLILILASNPLLRLPKGLLPSEFTTKIVYTFLISAMRVTSSLHRILVDIQ